MTGPQLCQLLGQYPILSSIASNLSLKELYNVARTSKHTWAFIAPDNKVSFDNLRELTNPVLSDRFDRAGTGSATLNCRFSSDDDSCVLFLSNDPGFSWHHSEWLDEAICVLCSKQPDRNKQKECRCVYQSGYAKHCLCFDCAWAEVKVQVAKARKIIFRHRGSDDIGYVLDCPCGSKFGDIMLNLVCSWCGNMYFDNSDYNCMNLELSGIDPFE
ncbi:uncharacterized protein K452DRAFT_317715 [Aplosporella prunicola CBS 121167]|uniref:Uncharacterized protein n=1 Tax=Aplosporella prunicola CBS 121167 TaxID=1176127 RepID=A0A6A6BF57_9PEZI|nr:uncharacterized protein K452DRAFT_317715 [Aplosporella prunicola CBS 121167]KAF2142800.1 hypothetical protein K452DRAFT_317715 [Aplosporella prunicola CBS 121167]